MSIHRLHHVQLLQGNIKSIWDFIAAPENLKVITPPYMGFVITSENFGEKMYPGMLISYKVSPVLGIRLNWLTEITHVDTEKFFVDEQRSGPYAFWHHQHHLQQTDEGVEMTDIVHYKLPLGFLGDMVNAGLVRNQLKEIFEFRRIKMAELFGE